MCLKGNKLQKRDLFQPKMKLISKCHDIFHK